MVEETELAIREIGHELADARLPTGEIERERAGADEALVVPDRMSSQLDSEPSHQFVERERLRQVVARPEAEPSKLRRQVGAGRDDHDRKLGHALL